MNETIENKRDEIEKLCKKYKVHYLELFGSAATKDKFVYEKSDFDFVVDFLPLNEGEYADTYFGLLEELESLLGRHVDLVMIKAVTNPYLLESINMHKELLFAA